MFSAWDMTYSASILSLINVILLFEEAIWIVGEFMKSEEYKDFKLSSYDALKKFAADEIGFRK